MRIKQRQWLLWWLRQEIPGWGDASWKDAAVWIPYIGFVQENTRSVCAEWMNNKPGDAEFLGLNQKLLLLSDETPWRCTSTRLWDQDRVSMAVFSWQCVLAVPLPSFVSASFSIVNTNAELRYLPTFLPAPAAPGAALRCGLWLSLCYRDLTQTTFVSSFITVPPRLSTLVYSSACYFCIFASRVEAQSHLHDQK